MGQPLYIPSTPILRAQQVESWAFQAAAWSIRPQANKVIQDHHSANLILEAVSDEEKPAILAAWKRGYTDGSTIR